jgi:hypothetical protein
VLAVECTSLLVTRRAWYCVLCGRRRVEWAIPSLWLAWGARQGHCLGGGQQDWKWAAGEARPVGTDVLETVAHADGSPHAWHLTWESTVLRLGLEDMRKRPSPDWSYDPSFDQLRWAKHYLEGIAYWDARVARAVARKMLDPDHGWDAINELGDQMITIQLHLWPNWEEIDHIGELCGIPTPQPDSRGKHTEERDMPGITCDREGVRTFGTGWLEQAIVEGRPTIARALIAQGADIHSAGDGGRTVLHWAAYHDADEVVAQLLEAGADANARDDEGRTPLYRAAEAGDVEACRVLLARGADASLDDDQGRTPLAAAERAGRAEVMALLGGSTAHP